MTARTFSRITWSGTLLFGAIVPFLYFMYWMPVSPQGMDPSLFERGIGTPGLLWMNGFLGPFFNYRFLGGVNWIALPLLGWAFFHWRLLPPWQRAAATFYLIAVAIIGGMGGFNYRYALTLQPFTVALVFVLLHQAFLHFGRSRTERRLFFATLAILSVANTALSLDHRKRIWAATPTYSSPDAGNGDLAERLNSAPLDLDGWLTVHGVTARDTVLVNNLPVYYYRTSRPGIYYWCGSDQLFTASGTGFLLKDRGPEETVAYLRDSLHCRTIFSTRELNTFNPDWSRFLDEHTVLVSTDPRGYTLHRLPDIFGRP